MNWAGLAEGGGTKIRVLVQVQQPIGKVSAAFDSGTAGGDLISVPANGNGDVNSLIEFWWERGDWCGYQIQMRQASRLLCFRFEDVKDIVVYSSCDDFLEVPYPVNHVAGKKRLSISSWWNATIACPSSSKNFVSTPFRREAAFLPWQKDN